MGLRNLVENLVFQILHAGEIFGVEASGNAVARQGRAAAKSDPRGTHLQVAIDKIKQRLFVIAAQKNAFGVARRRVKKTVDDAAGVRAAVDVVAEIYNHHIAAALVGVTVDIPVQALKQIRSSMDITNGIDNGSRRDLPDKRFAPSQSVQPSRNYPVLQGACSWVIARPQG